MNTLIVKDIDEGASGPLDNRRFRKAEETRHTKRNDKSLGDLALMFNSKVQGWINYYGRFYRSRLAYFLRRLNARLVRWACRKYDKRLRNRERRAMELLAGAARRSPWLFAHWRLGALLTAGRWEPDESAPGPDPGRRSPG